MNTNCLKDIMCPQCGHTEDFDFLVNIWVKVEDEGTDNMIFQDIEWDDNTLAGCPNCGHREQLSEFKQPSFYVTFQRVTEESAAHGEAESSGWWEPGGWEFDDKPDEPAYQFDPDGDYDKEEHGSIQNAVIEWAVKLLKDQGATHFSGNDWWSTEPEQDMHDGSYLTLSFHPEGFDDLIKRINQEL